MNKEISNSQIYDTINQHVYDFIRKNVANHVWNSIGSSLAARAYWAVISPISQKLYSEMWDFVDDTVRTPVENFMLETK